MSQSSSSLSRMLSVLDLFTLAHPEWTVDAMAAALGHPSSTTYRYVKELTRVGLLARLPGGTYVVGAKVIALEMLVRHADPVARLAKPILEELATHSGCTAMMANVYGDDLINVAYEDGLERIDLTYLRGAPLPWFRGAPGKAAAAFLPTARARALYAKHECGGQFDESRWKSCLSELRRIRTAGFSISLGELDNEVVGFGVPVMPEGAVTGSISLACSRGRADMLNHAGLAEMLRAKARQLSEVILTRQHATL